MGTELVIVHVVDVCRSLLVKYFVPFPSSLVTCMSFPMHDSGCFFEFFVADFLVLSPPLFFVVPHGPEHCFLPFLRCRTW